MQQQEKEILQIEEQKNRLIGDMEKIRLQEQTKRQGFQDRIDEHKQQIEKKKKAIEEKVQEFERSKQLKMMEIEQLKQDYEKAYKKRSEMEVRQLCSISLTRRSSTTSWLTNSTTWSPPIRARSTPWRTTSPT